MSGSRSVVRAVDRVFCVVDDCKSLHPMCGGLLQRRDTAGGRSLSSVQKLVCAAATEENDAIGRAV